MRQILLPDGGRPGRRRLILTVGTPPYELTLLFDRVMYVPARLKEARHGDQRQKPDGGHQIGGPVQEAVDGLEVVKGEEGKLRYRLEDGGEFKSPSAAGSAVMGGNACNGWNFWSLEAKDAPTPEQTQQVGATEAPGEEESPKATETMDEDQEQGETQEETSDVAVELAHSRRRISRIPNQRGMPEGQTRWYCQDCGKSFNAPSGEKPRACPQGHPAEK